MLFKWLRDIFEVGTSAISISHCPQNTNVSIHMIHSCGGPFTEKNFENNSTTVPQKPIKEILMTNDKPFEMSLHFFISSNTIIEIIW